VSRGLSALGEFGLIDRIRQAAKPTRPWVETGIGDDCAVLKLTADRRLLVTTDMLIDRVHFMRGRLTPGQLGRKALAVNLSDIAAMGGEPLAAFLAMGLTADLDEGYVMQLRDGVLACAAEHGVDLLGGDTVASRSDLTLCLTVLGQAGADEVIRRSGARPGDRILLGGRVGDSAAGLHLILGKPGQVSDSGRAQLLASHLEPRPQLALGRLLATRHLATAMIDVSDGVLLDLAHICQESGVGAELDADALPVSEAARELAGSAGLDARDWALGGGEDYVLLLCVAAPRLAETVALARRELSLPLYEVGAITAAGLRVRRDGVWRESPPVGYDAFRT
jgi:thiamine-monophosphate kinase